MRLSVIIPVYNECATIAELLRQVESVAIDKEIIVVDDFSADGSRDVLRQIKSPLVRVFYHDQNRGKGAAVRTGLEHARGEYVIIQDADLEYDPREYPKLLAPLLKGEADVVYGSRFMGQIRQMTAIQRIGNRFLTVLTNILYRTSLTDMETCYKVMPTKVLQGIRLRSRAFEFDPEVTAKLLRRGFRVKEVPIDYTARATAEGKKISWTHGFPALWCLIKYRFVD